MTEIKTVFSGHNGAVAHISSTTASKDQISTCKERGFGILLLAEEWLAIHDFSRRQFSSGVLSLWSYPGSSKSCYNCSKLDSSMRIQNVVKFRTHEFGREMFCSFFFQVETKWRIRVRGNLQHSWTALPHFVDENKSWGAGYWRKIAGKR